MWANEVEEEASRIFFWGGVLFLKNFKKNPLGKKEKERNNPLSLCGGSCVERRPRVALQSYSKSESEF